VDRSKDILRTEKITDQKWINLFVRTYRHNGREYQWVFASRKPEPEVPAAGADAVVIVPVLLAEGQPPRLVVTKEYRVPLGSYEYGCPAGLLEPGESVEEAVRRELREETGMEVVAITRVSPVVYSSGGLSDESVVMVFVTVRATPDMQQALEGSEDIEVLLLDYDQVCALCHSDERINGKVWPVLYMYEQLGKLA
jgi:ADP-ribose pyrophosphatase